MKKSKPSTSELTTSQAPSSGHLALDAYTRALSFLTANCSNWPWDRRLEPELLFIKELGGIENLYRTMSAIAPAVPNAHDEEWNPLSQRPHSPLPPAISDELGAEVSSLKEAVDAFTTLSHEMMHVALCEPFFTGVWRPRNLQSFREFFLLSEGFCFFFSDIVVSAVVRARLPDGELALERATPSNAHFHPIRAFNAMGIQDRQTILDIYLESFSGRGMPLIQRQGTSGFAAALALKIHAFYADSRPYLKDLQGALASFGGLTEFHHRFCSIPGLPSILDESTARLANGGDLKLYFAEFFCSGLRSLDQMTANQVAGVRWRRMLQMRAFYALQVRWLLSEDQVVAHNWSAALRRRLQGYLGAYLDGLQELLLQLGRQPDVQPLHALKQLDTDYDARVRSCFLAHEAWAAHRWLIAPRRANGAISVSRHSQLKVRNAKSHLLETIEFLVDELALRLGENRKAVARAEALARIQQVAALGAVVADGNAAQIQTATRKLRAMLIEPHLLEIWSLPLASFDPAHNQYRELLFSYK